MSNSNNTPANNPINKAQYVFSNSELDILLGALSRGLSASSCAVEFAEFKQLEQTILQIQSARR